MNTGAPTDLTPGDRAVIANEVKRLRERTPTRDPQFPGCLVAFLAMLVLTLTPAIGNWVDIPREAALGLFAVAVAGLFAGALVALFGSSIRTRTARRDCESAVGPILAHTEGEGSREAAVRAAVRLLSSAVVDPGPGATHTFRPDEMARRLGPAGLRLLLAVERHRLATDGEIRPVFTPLPEATRE